MVCSQQTAQVLLLLTAGCWKLFGKIPSPVTWKTDDLLTESVGLGNYMGKLKCLMFPGFFLLDFTKERWKQTKFAQFGSRAGKKHKSASAYDVQGKFGDLSSWKSQPFCSKVLMVNLYFRTFLTNLVRHHIQTRKQLRGKDLIKGLSFPPKLTASSGLGGAVMKLRKYRRQ